MRQLLLWPPSEPPPTAASSSFLLLKRLRVAQLVEEALKAMRGPALADELGGEGKGPRSRDAAKRSPIAGYPNPVSRSPPST
jgi:hypothetical protein